VHGVRVARVAPPAFVRIGPAYVLRANVPIVPVQASGLTDRAFGPTDQVYQATGRSAPARVPIVPAYAPTVLLFGRIVRLPGRNVQPRVHSVPRRGHPGPQRGHNNDLHPAQVSSPRDRSHVRADRNSARRYSGQPTARTFSVLRPTGPDRRAHGPRRNALARREGACGNRRTRHLLAELVGSSRCRNKSRCRARFSTAVLQSLADGIELIDRA
jgi:hypothetical protein